MFNLNNIKAFIIKIIIADNYTYNKKNMIINK
jgi:hypothetical protein